MVSDMSEIKVLGVSGSPRKGRNTDSLLNAALEAAREAGAETELLSLAGLNILACTGCNACVKEKRCPLDEEDEMAQVKEMLLEADAVILAAPSYFGGPPGVMKSMMDRSRSLKMNDHRLKDKVVSALSLAGLRHGAAEQVTESLIRFGLTHGMIAVGGCDNPLNMSHFAVASLQGDQGWRRVSDDEIGLLNAKGVGRRVVEVANALRR